MTGQTHVPLLDINRDNHPLREEFVEALTAVVDSGRFLFGPDVSELEKEIASHCQAEHAIGCASGSDALLLALMALDLKPGDEVIVPSFTFFASVSCITRLGATPVFVDIPARHVQRRSTVHLRRDHRKHESDHSRSPLRAMCTD